MKQGTKTFLRKVVTKGKAGALITAVFLAPASFAEDNVFSQIISEASQMGDSIMSLILKYGMYALALAPIVIFARILWQIIQKRREMQMANQSNPLLQATIESFKSGAVWIFIYSIVLVFLGIFMGENPLSILSSIYHKFLSF